MKKFEVCIEYCPKCHWMLRAAWLAQEILVTFEDEISKISLKPSETAGLFQIVVDQTLIFDRKTYGGFAEPKIYKQLIRDYIDPSKSLGHSDKTPI